MVLIAGDGGASGNDPTAQSAISAFRLAASGGTRQDATVPLWRTRPRGPQKRHKWGGTIGGPQPSDYYSRDFAVSSFMDMNQQDRDKFAMYALRYGLVRPQDQGDPGAIMNAWEQMVTAAAQYNSSRPNQGQWISPWEAVHRFAGKRLAGSDGSVDLYRPQTNRTVNKRKFTREEIQPTLDEIFQREMGRTPTKRELNVYLKAIQSAYNRHPETQVQQVRPGPNGTNVTNTISGGVDVPAELMNRVRGSSESDAYQAGVTYMQALEQAVRPPV